MEKKVPNHQPVLSRNLETIRDWDLSTKRAAETRKLWLWAKATKIDVIYAEIYSKKWEMMSTAMLGLKALKPEAQQNLQDMRSLRVAWYDSKWSSEWNQWGSNPKSFDIYIYMHIYIFHSFVLKALTESARKKMLLSQVTNVLM